MTIPVALESLFRVVLPLEPQKIDKPGVAGFDLLACRPAVVSQVIPAAVLDGAVDDPLKVVSRFAFAFFAMTASFIGLAIAFFDFWADGLKWPKKGKKRLGICALVFGIPLAIVWINPGAFLGALNLAGGLGVAILLCIYPMLFVWSGRYIQRHAQQHPMIKGGKFILSAMLLFTLLFIYLSYV